MVDDPGISALRERVIRMEVQVENLAEGFKSVAMLRDQLIKISGMLDHNINQFMDANNRIRDIEHEGRDYRAAVADIERIDKLLVGENSKNGLIENTNYLLTWVANWKGRTAAHASLWGGGFGLIGAFTALAAFLGWHVKN